VVKDSVSDSLKYGRVLLKITGESLCAKNGRGIDAHAVSDLAGRLVEVASAGVQLAVVIGGGNILRGGQIAGKNGIKPATAHYMGMVATVMNGLALADCIEDQGGRVYLASSFPVGQFVQGYSRRDALRALEGGQIVILCGGTGNPFVTTDTCAAIRAAELSAEALLKATKVDGVYSADPHKDQAAQKFDRLSYDAVIDSRLGVMDLSAVQLCKQCGISIIVFNFRTAGNILAVARGQAVGTLISAEISAKGES